MKNAYKNNSAKELISQGYVYATSAKNATLKTKRVREALAGIDVKKIATTGYYYDVYCKPADVKKVNSVL